MKIEDLAAKLNCRLRLEFIPEIEDRETRNSVPNPTPWHCQKIDYSSDHGKGTTPNQACAGLVESMIQSARETLARESDSKRYAVENLEALVKMQAELTEP